METEWYGTGIHGKSVVGAGTFPLAGKELLPFAPNMAAETRGDDTAAV